MQVLKEKPLYFQSSSGEWYTSSLPVLSCVDPPIRKKAYGKFFAHALLEHEFDEGIGLNYAGARYYDPDVAMWISPDPARQFHSLYRYTTNPINMIDPDGMEEIYYLLGSTFSARHLREVISAKKFKTVMGKSSDEYASKGYKSKFGYLSKGSLLTALNDPDIQKIYILAHSAENKAGIMDRKMNWVEPKDLQIDQKSVSTIISGCYSQNHQQSWWDKILGLIGLQSDEVKASQALKDLKNAAETDAALSTTNKKKN